MQRISFATVIVNMLAGQISRQHHLRTEGQRLEAVDVYDHVLKAHEQALRSRLSR